MAIQIPPPRLARSLALLLLRGDAREVIVGDLDQEFAEAISSGVRPARARRQYWRQTIASITAARRPAHSQRARVRPLHLVRGLSLDLTAVLRVLRRSPGYAAIAVLSLAIGIGANTTIFSVARQLLMMPLPVERPDELRIVYWTPRHNGALGINNIAGSGFAGESGLFYRSNFTYPQFTAMQHVVAGSANLAAYNFLRGLTASVNGRPPVATTGMLASGNFFETVRPPFALGRGLSAPDDTAGAPVVAVISHGLWTRLFDNDPGVLGKTVRVNNVPVEIVGVTAAGYRGLSLTGFTPATDVTVALAKQPVISPEWSGTTSLFTSPRTYWVRLIARAPGATDAAIRDALQATFGSLLLDGGIKPEIAAKSSVGVFPGARGLDSLRRGALLPLRILAAVAGVVLFIACVNVAGLMLARGVSRQREMAVRRALGAGRGRIMRELLLESVLLSVAGGATGLVVALWMAPTLQTMVAAGLGATGVTVALDWPLLIAATAIACAAGILAGLLPALRFSRSAGALLGDRSGAAGTPRLRIGRVLLALQIGVSLPLVAGAGLFLRTLHNLGGVDLGFNPHEVVLFTIDPTMNGRKPEQRTAIYPRLLERLEAIPGVTSATLLENALISGSESNTSLIIGGREVEIYWNSIGPHYHETMGVPLVAGRSIRPSDTDRGAHGVAVLNQTAAQQIFGTRAPIGARFHMPYGKRDVEVVGIAADSKYGGLRSDIEPTMLLSYLQMPVGSMTVAVRSPIPAAALRASIEAAVREVDPSVPIADYQTQLEQIDQTIGKELVFTRLLTLFGAVALLLACVGLHGVTSYSVARRTPEIGIRLALGAQRPRILWLVLRQVVVLAAAGLVIGLPIAWLTAPVTGAFLFGLNARDPLTILAAAALLVLVALVAGIRPARRAARLEALAALRSE
jgi:predicted permease